MKITFLGTGTSQGVPIIACDCVVCKSIDSHDKRLRSSVLVEVEGLTFVIDAGPDFRMQMLREQVKSIDAILITHNHKDHTGGIDDVRAFNYILQRPIDIYANNDTVNGLKKELFYAFENDKYPGVPEINLHALENKIFKIGPIDILPIEVLHYKSNIFGYRIGGFVYVTDANFIASAEFDKLRNAEVIVLNALRREPHVTHFTLNQAIDILKELRPKQAFLTHISHQMGLYKDVEKELPDFIHLAYDGLQVII